MRLLLYVLLLGAGFQTYGTVSASEPAGRNTVTLKSGTFVLDTASQELEIDDYCYITCGWYNYYDHPIAVEVNTDTRDVVDIEYERRSDLGYSYGAELLHYATTYTIPSLNPADGEMSVTMLFGNVKKYYGSPQGLRLFIAMGAGFIDASMNGAISEEGAIGPAVQAFSGIRYNVGRYSVIAEYRYLLAPSTHVNEATTAVNEYLVRGDLDLSGSGAFVGLGYDF